MAPTAGTRERVVEFTAGDGFKCNLIHVTGERTPDKGPVVLVHGAGVRANIFRAPVRTTIVDYLIERGYDVWLENWRASIDVKSGAFTAAKGLEFMYVFHSDHTLTESSNYDAAPPVPPAYGVWRSVPGNGTVFEAKYEFFTTAPSPPEQSMAGAGWLP